MSRVEVVSSRAGDPVIKWDGRHLGSAIDPKSEAQRWADLRDRGCIYRHWNQVVLGVGSGYHVTQVLLRTTGRVVLVEPEREICAAVERLHETEWAHHRGRIRFLGSSEELPPESHLWINSLCFGGRPKEFHRLLGCLTGRRLSAFSDSVAGDPELSACFEPTRLNDLSQEQWIGINEVRRCARPQAITSRTGRLWAVLEELVR